MSKIAKNKITIAARARRARRTKSTPRSKCIRFRFRFAPRTETETKIQSAKREPTKPNRNGNRNRKTENGTPTWRLDRFRPVQPIAKAHPCRFDAGFSLKAARNPEPRHARPDHPFKICGSTHSTTLTNSDPMTHRRDPNQPRSGPDLVRDRNQKREPKPKSRPPEINSVSVSVSVRAPG